MSNIPLEQARAAETSASTESTRDAPTTGVEACHGQTRKQLELQLVGRDGPYKDVRYALYADGQLVAQDRRTDGEGWIREDVGAAAKAELRVWFDAFPHPEIFFLTLTKQLPPVDSDEGLAIRLRNLGAGVGGDNVVQDVHVRNFQRRFGLAETGTVDNTLRADVKRVYGL